MKLKIGKVEFEGTNEELDHVLQKFPHLLERVGRIKVPETLKQGVEFLND